jgi:hypothetical protein
MYLLYFVDLLQALQRKRIILNRIDYAKDYNINFNIMFNPHTIIK